MKNLSPLLSLLALAWQRARGRFAAVLVLVFSALVLAFSASLGRRLGQSASLDAREAASAVLLLHTRCMLWGPGLTAVVLSTLHAWRRDDQDGVLALVQRTGHSLRSYFLSRVLALFLGVTALWASSWLLLALWLPSAASLTEHLGAALVWALSCGALLSALAASCLGPRSRPGGYALLALILFVPDVLAPWLRQHLPDAWSSVPSLLTELARSVSDGGSVEAAQAWLGLLVLLAALLAATAWSATRWRAPRPAEATS